MTKINILSPLLADMIAAGEVVERPASVIKELMENAFDAGAKKITVEFKKGGATFIRVTDDGCGMSPEDAGIAFMRHATSKLRDEKGLEAIGTMGFRGEALAAISAVSKIELITREKGAPEGTRMLVEAGDIVDMSACGCPEGTSITVRDIFFNTPARLKFLKSDRSESGACLAAALRCALGRPAVSVRCIKDGEESFFTPGDGRLDSNVYSLLGRETAGTLLPLSAELEDMSVTGFVSSPAKSKGSRSAQFFYCNGRYIKSALLQAAVEQAYKNTLLTGRFPACTVYLTLRASSVDVNVHPAKTEVKFADEKRVFDLVYQSVRAALEAEEKPLTIELSESTKKAVSNPRPDFWGTMSAESYRRETSPQTAKTDFSAQRTSRSAQAPTAVLKAAPRAEYSPLIPEIPRRNVEKTVENVEKIATKAFNVIGEALDTYILAEDGDELVLIDKHAAHERMIFDKLKAQDAQIMSQTLLAPVILKPSAEDADTLEAQGEKLSSLGFELEPYGADAYAVRAVPEGLDIGEVPAALEELCGKLRRGADTDSERDELLHTVACKAAIKAGRRHDRAELEVIAAKVLRGEVKYCPHGRPVAVRLGKKELDKFFSRIV